MKKIFKKYRFLKYGIVIAAIDIFSRNSFQMGGGVLLLIAAIVAVAFTEKMEKDEKKDHHRMVA